MVKPSKGKGAGPERQDEPLKVNGSFMDIIHAVAKDAKNKKKKAAPQNTETKKKP